MTVRRQWRAWALQASLTIDDSPTLRSTMPIGGSPSTLRCGAYANKKSHIFQPSWV